MNRFLTQDLLDWKKNPEHKPLILQGARQVGKTWLLQQFGKDYFEDVVYFSFDQNTSLSQIFAPDLDLNRIVLALEALSHTKITPQKTLVIFDEIQECPQALTSLKYFCEQKPQYYICAAGSFLGFVEHTGTGFPVGKVDLLTLHPLSFREFLDAMGEERLQHVLDAGDWTLVKSLDAAFQEQLSYYFVVGGMPEAVAHFAKHGKMDIVRQIQQNILVGYQFDISKHLTPQKTERALAVYESIPSQLAKENKRFVYERVQGISRATQLQEAITWLCHAGLVQQSEAVQKPQIPLKALATRKQFKLFNLDVGLFGASAQLEPASLLMNEYSNRLRGALAEQFVFQQLVSDGGFTPFYWSGRTQGNRSELDFIVQSNAHLIACEVKAGTNVHSKSLQAAYQRFPHLEALRFSMRPYQKAGWLTNYPLYAIGSPSVWGKKADAERGC